MSLPSRIAERYRREAAENYAVTLEEHVIHDARSPRAVMASVVLVVIGVLLVLIPLQAKYGDQHFTPAELR
jgi:hypothetical protein